MLYEMSDWTLPFSHSTILADVGCCSSAGQGGAESAQVLLPPSMARVCSTHGPVRALCCHGWWNLLQHQHSSLSTASNQTDAVKCPVADRMVEWPKRCPVLVPLCAQKKTPATRGRGKIMKKHYT